MSMGKQLFTVKVSGVGPESLSTLSMRIEDPLLDVSVPDARSFGPDDWYILIAVLRDVGTVAGAVLSISRLAKAIYDWARNERDKSPAFKGTMQAPGKPKLELTSASESEVVEWLGAYSTPS
jgi:hypothetical protein